MGSGYGDIADLAELVDEIGCPSTLGGARGFNATALRLCANGALKVLDAGCGKARLRRPIEEQGHAYVGLDLDEPAADIKGDLSCLPLADESFDLVLCRGVLQCILQPEIALSELRRVLKADGMFLCEVPFLEPWVWGSKLHFSPYGIARLATAAGFRIVNCWAGWSVWEALALALDRNNAPLVAQGDKTETEAKRLSVAASVLILAKVV